MDDDGETTYETPMLLCFNLKMHLYLCLLVNETKNPVILCVVALELHGVGVSVETQLMPIIISIVLDCVGNTIPLVWYPTFTQQKHR